MNGANRPLGYTIIEVLIVLAISGVMFLIASEFISGKEESTSFTQGVTSMASEIQNVIQQVDTGQYSDIGLNCTYNGSITTVVTGTNPQGTNNECVFLGKMMRFSGLGQANYEVISLAGGQLNPANFPANPNPQVLLTAAAPAVIDALTTSQTIQQQLDVTGMSVTDASGAIHRNTFYNFGFVLNLGTPDGNGSFESGSQPISMVYSPVTTAQADSSINNNVYYAQSATLCVSDNAQLAKITIGVNNDQLGVDTTRLNVGSVCP